MNQLKMGFFMPDNLGSLKASDFKKIDLKNTVIYLLESKPETRDNDEILCAYVWRYQLIFSNKPAEIFLVAYRDGCMVSADAITRCRRVVQRENVHLRGKYYEKRQKHCVKVRDSFKDGSDPNGGN